LGFCTFRFCIDSERCTCPLCRRRFQEETCGFYATEYRYHGYQEGNSTKIDSGWRKAPNNGYTTFDDSPEHFVPWRQLTIEAKEGCIIQ